MSRPMELFCRSLGRRDQISSVEQTILENLSQRPAEFRRGTEIIADGSRPSVSCLLVAGLSARAVYLPDGRRQFTALHVPGDFVDLHALLLKTMDHSVVAVSDCSVVFVPHAELVRVTETAPHLTRMLWLSTTIDAAIQREMIASIGRRTQLQRLAHLICEQYLRLEVVGLATDGSFSFPITQSDLADVLGLSLVHTNRTVQDLRATNLISWRQADITIHEFERLSSLAQFDPG